MPYYHVIPEGPYRGEKEVSGIIHHRRLSFVTPLELGPRKNKLFGPKQLSIEVMSHDVAIARVVWGEKLLLHLKHHEQENEDPQIIEQPGLVVHSEYEEVDDRYRSVCLFPGIPLRLFRSSLWVDDHFDEQLHWFPGDILDYLDLEIIKESLRDRLF